MEPYFAPVALHRCRLRQYFATLWEAVEEQNAVRITLHDHTGCLMLFDGNMMRENGNIHQCEYCRFNRKHRLDSCINHCHWRVMREAARIAGPFVHHCHAGAVELVLPVMVRNQHLATVFAGTFRDAAVAPPPSWSATQRELYLSLSLWRQEAMPTLLRTLQMFSAAALAFVGEERFHALKEHGRRSEIEEFFQHNVAVKGIGLNDLAAHLGLSPSRTSHLLREELHQTFSKMLRSSRIRVACRLLMEGELSLKRIAALTGFNDEYYFSRAFRRETGLPPGQYRSQARPPTEDGHGTQEVSSCSRRPS
ncbi:MAG: helix-turn-helix domain-containing protein [Victivallales bacterium]|nr:helix-turn-helix domain-containing protein [Victivallales bacterium]